MTGAARGDLSFGHASMTVRLVHGPRHARAATGEEPRRRRCSCASSASSTWRCSSVAHGHARSRIRRSTAAASPWSLAAFVGFIVGLAITNPRAELPTDSAARRPAAGGSSARPCSAAIQPKGLWQASPVLHRRGGRDAARAQAGVAVLAVTLAVLATVARRSRRVGLRRVSVLVGVVPWFLLIRADARACATRTRSSTRSARGRGARPPRLRERGRVAREMHDVLAHSLSALALQLESTRLLARDRGADPEVTRGDRPRPPSRRQRASRRRAARSARCAATSCPVRSGSTRSPRPSSEQSGVVARSRCSGEPRALAAEARLALYRTAQEALTNVRRHAAPERVELQLDYRDDGTRAHGRGPRRAAGAPRRRRAPGGGYGLTGMRERAELLGGRLAAEPTRRRLPRGAVAAGVTRPSASCSPTTSGSCARASRTLLGLLDGHRARRPPRPTARRRSRSRRSTSPTSC